MDKPEFDIYIPPSLIPLFAPPRGSFAYRIMYGGRGSAKSLTAAQVILVWAACEKIRVLCGRQFQNSIPQSFFAELKNALDITPELAKFFDIKKDSITSTCGSEFFFKGFDRNIEAAKSISNVDVTIIEEAEQINEAAYISLLPTVRRRNKSEIWIITNPREENSATDKRFIKRTPPRSKSVEISYKDNPYFPAGLEEERLDNYETMPYPLYAHIWEGAYLTENEFSVYKRDWFVERHNYTIADWEKFQNIFHSWDTAFKTNEANDPSAGIVVGVMNDGRAYLLHVINKRMEYGELKKAIIDLQEAAPASTILIEDKASGQSLLQELNANYPVKGIKPEGDKYSRAYASTEPCSSGRFILPAQSSWLHEYEKQLLFFTGNPKIDKNHDDMVDATSQFINYWKKRKRVFVNGVFIDN